MAAPLNSGGSSQSSGQSSGSDRSNPQNSSDKKHEKAGAGGTAKIVGESVPAVVSQSNSSSEQAAKPLSKRDAVPAKEEVPTSIGEVERITSYVVEDEAINQEKQALVAICKILAESTASQEEREQYKLLGEMFHKLFLYEVPDSLADLRHIKSPQEAFQTGDSQKILLTNLTRFNTEPEYRLKVWLEQLVTKFKTHTQFFTPIDKSIGVYIRKNFRKAGYCRVLEVGSGTGWYAAAISHAGNPQKKIPAVTVTATDSKEALFSDLSKMGKRGEFVQVSGDDKPFEPQAPLTDAIPIVATEKTGIEQQIEEKIEGNITVSVAHPIEFLSAIESIEKYAHSHDILLVTSPVPDIVHALKNWPGDKPIFWVSKDTLKKYAKDLGYDVQCEVVESDLNQLALPRMMGGDKDFIVQVIKIKHWKEYKK